jgi:hypothetical protein
VAHRPGAASLLDDQRHGQAGHARGDDRAAQQPGLKYAQGSREFIATTRIRRSAFNMTAYPSMVADDIDIEIGAILRKAR